MKNNMKKCDEVVIYTTMKVAKKKQSKRFSVHCWEFSRAPRTWPDIKRIYFAFDGKVQGSFAVRGHGTRKKGGKYKKLLWFDPRSWRKTRYKLPVKSFRGFRYRWW